MSFKKCGTSGMEKFYAGTYEMLSSHCTSLATTTTTHTNTTTQLLIMDLVQSDRFQISKFFEARE